MTAAVRWSWTEIDAEQRGDDVRLVHGADAADLEFKGGRLRRGPRYGSGSPETRRALARLGAILRLRQRGRFYVHAAGVVDPAGQAWLLPSGSGGGKSTLAYALVRQGWSLLGDDGVILEMTADCGLRTADCGLRTADGRVWALPWRDPLRVSSDLLPYFPELRELVARSDRKAIAADPRRRLAIPCPLALPAPVGALVFVSRAGVDRVTQLAPAEALAALIRQSALVALGDTPSGAHLAVLSALINSVPAFRLDHTPVQLTAIAATLAAALVEAR